jgi:hypothetical protein
MSANVAYISLSTSFLFYKSCFESLERKYSTYFDEVWMEIVLSGACLSRRHVTNHFSGLPFLQESFVL